MNILCDRQQLQEAFAVAASVSPAKSTRPALQHVELRADDSGLTIYGTDQEIAVRCTLESVQVKTPGTCLLPARQTSQLLKELTDQSVSLSAKDQRCKIESGGGSFVLLGEDPEQFPDFPDLEDGAQVNLPAGRLLEMSQQSAFAAAREATRYAIHGVLFEVTDERLNLVATDGRRLALVYESIADQSVPATRAVVPLRVLSALTRSLPDGEDQPVHIVFGERQIGFRSGNLEVISQLLDNRFPDYTAVIPRASESAIELDRALLERCVRRVSIMSPGDMRVVRFDFGQDSLQLSAESSDVGRGDVSMEAVVKGPGGAINFNGDYVLEALKVCDLETVHLDITDDSAPARFALGEAFTYVLMPISGT